MFTKKHYREIANIIFLETKCGSWGDYLSSAKSDYLASNNPHFDREKFKIACERGIKKL